MDRSVAVDPVVGRLLDGRYRVGERIARGGMATVYEGIDLRLDRLVALKVMPPALADDEAFSQRFVREARAAARLTHPNVVAVYDQGEDNGTLFLAMEYIPGRHTLRDLIRDQAPLPPRRALALLEEMLKAIAAAHESGIVHRDVKPENVLLDPRGQVKVADFGLARAISSATSATATGGVLMGTVSYLPPELVTDGTADARSDVYALGVLLFELLTGEKPHQGDSPIQVAYKHVHDDVPPPSSLVEGVPAYLDAFVARATSRERDLRPADAHVMLQQLRRVRHALDNGVLEDQELTDDLTPMLVARRLADQTPDGWSPDGWPPDGWPTAGSATVGSATVDSATVDSATVDRPRVGRRVGQQAGRGATGLGTGGLGAGGAVALGAADEVFDFAAYDDVRDDVDPGREGRPARVATGPSARRHRRRAGWIALVVVLLLAAGAGVGGWYYGIGRYTSAPDVVSMGQDVAQARVERAGLTFQISAAAYSEKVPDGHVISTDPAPGGNVLKHGTVTAVISKGPERHAVPDLSRLSEAKAIATITGNRLTVATPQRVWSGRVARGKVISIRPRAGTELRRGASVQLVVSKGPRPIRVDDYTGSTAAKARRALEALGLRVTGHRVYDDQVAQGDVLSQSPDRGVLHKGDDVSLVVSRGPHLVTVPNVLHAGAADATSMLQQAGFKVTLVHYDPYFGLDIVVGQSTGGGAQAPYGSTITLHIV